MAVNAVAALPVLILLSAFGVEATNIGFEIIPAWFVDVSHREQKCDFCNSFDSKDKKHGSGLNSFPLQYVIIEISRQNVTHTLIIPDILAVNVG